MELCPIFGITFLAVIYKTNCKQMINFMYHTSDENKLRFKPQESTFIIINCTLWVYITIIPWAWVKWYKITNERVARVGYNHFISNKGEWNNCFSKFSNRVMPLIFLSTVLQSVRKENLAHYFPYDVKLGLLADSRSFLANQKARNAIVGAENLLIKVILCIIISLQ